MHVYVYVCVRACVHAHVYGVRFLPVFSLPVHVIYLYYLTRIIHKYSNAHIRIVFLFFFTGRTTAHAHIYACVLPIVSALGQRMGGVLCLVVPSAYNKQQWRSYSGDEADGGGEDGNILKGWR